MNAETSQPQINHQSPPRLSVPQSKREIYLFSTLGLNHDPFMSPVAELELQTQPDDPPFFSYFVNIPNPTNKETLLLNDLNQNQHAFIYCANGGGKTTFCTNLEALCRSLSGQTLVISHAVGKEGESTTAEGMTWKALNQSLAIDLFIQLSEQFNQIDPLVIKEHQQSLYHFWSYHIPEFNHTVERIIQRGHLPDKTGLSIWWLPWNRPAVRYAPLTQDLRTFWQNLTQLSSAEQELHTVAGVPTEPREQLSLTKENAASVIEDKQSFLAGLNLARAVGYQQVYLLIDIAGGEHSERDNLDMYLATFTQLIALPTPIPLYLKNFLPVAWYTSVERLMAGIQLTASILSAIIDWQDGSLLQQLIANRFRTAGSWIENLDTIASQELAGQLEQQLITSAFGSPRRLLQLISNLVDVHARRAPTEMIFTFADWQAAQILT